MCSHNSLVTESKQLTCVQIPQNGKWIVLFFFPKIADTLEKVVYFYCFDGKTQTFGVLIIQHPSFWFACLFWVTSTDVFLENYFWNDFDLSSKNSVSNEVRLLSNRYSLWLEALLEKRRLFPEKRLNAHSTSNHGADFTPFHHCEGR